MRVVDAMQNASRPPSSELLLLDQLHGVLTVVGDRGGFEPPTIAFAIDPETDLGARYHPLLFHAAVANHRFHIFRRPVRVPQIVGEPEFDARTGHHLVGRVSDASLRLQRRFGRPGAVVVDVRWRQTLGRASRFVASHRRFRAEGEECDDGSCCGRNDVFGHDDPLA